MLACSGSVPPESPPDAYGRLPRWRRRRPAIVVDAGGATLDAALGAAPDVVAPNLAEAEEAAPARRDGRPAGAEAEVRPRARGRRAALVAARRARRGRARPPRRAPRWRARDARHLAPRAAVADVRNPIGAGDALVGGAGRGARARRAARGCAPRRGGRRGERRDAEAGELDPARAAELLDRLELARAG